jgi:hypothetical protein
MNALNFVPFVIFCKTPDPDFTEGNEANKGRGRRP